MQAFQHNVSQRYSKNQMNHTRSCFLSQVSIITTKANALENNGKQNQLITNLKHQEKIKEKENNNNLFLAQKSKKIQKTNTVAQRIPFRNLTNNAVYQEKQLHQQFLEDSFFRSKKIPKISFIKFRNQRTKTIHEFRCFKESDLNIPLQLQESVLKHQIDNDCTTDEDQIKSAIRTLYSSLESAVKQYQEQKNQQENQKEESKSFSI